MKHIPFPKIFLVKADIKQLLQKKNWEVLMKIEGIQAISVLRGQNPPPTPRKL